MQKLRTGTAFPGDISDSIVYQLPDHLGSSNLRLSTTGTIIDKEEYYPFGDTSLRTFTYKRYRYVGKEKDNESGLYYYGARYYASWTCRFISIDPLADNYADLTPYNYAANKPINKMDIDGLQAEGQQETVTNGGNNDSVTDKQQIDLETRPQQDNLSIWNNESYVYSFDQAQRLDAYQKEFADKIQVHFENGYTNINDYHFFTRAKVSDTGYVEERYLEYENGTVRPELKFKAPDGTVLYSDEIGWGAFGTPDNLLRFLGRDLNTNLQHWESVLYNGNVRGRFQFGDPSEYVKEGIEETVKFLVVQVAVAQALKMAQGAFRTTEVIEAEQTYEISDGVRRAKAAQMLGKKTITAEVNSTGEIIEIPINNLRSPHKSAIDISNPGTLKRFNQIYESMETQGLKIPIFVSPGNRGILVEEITFIQ
ncbi:MAG: RHS repeat-associated core domain-containing protein [Bacteroidota bacterium]